MKELLMDFLNAKNYLALKDALKDVNPADIPALFDELGEKDLIILFRLLPKDSAAEAFSYMDRDIQEKLINLFSDKELGEVLDRLFMDDTVDIIEEMPASVVKRILKTSNPDSRKIINEILKYPKDSAGSIMTTELIDLRKQMTVSEAFERIRRTGITRETIYTCYVTENRKLLGIVTVKDMLVANNTSKISDIMETNIISVNTHEDREFVAGLFRKYDFLALPVVDTENRLVGIVTIDDVLDVLDDEVSEDIAKMAAITPSNKPYLKTGVLDTWKSRMPWLMFLMISATFTGKIIFSFESALSSYVVLASFIPMIMDTGGNAGSQASVTIIRSLSLNEVHFKDIWKIIFKELRVSFLCGITLATAGFVKFITLDKMSLPVSFVVCLTLLFTVVAAKFIGCCLPILAKKIGFDPAVMASPFITTIVDAMSLIVYFNLATVLLHL